MATSQGAPKFAPFGFVDTGGRRCGENTTGGCIASCQMQPRAWICSRMMEGCGLEAFFLLFFLSGVKFGFLPQENGSLIAHLREVLILPAHTLPT